jgi:glycosyltransferase involved in cell wall biosynthesis
MTTPTRPVRVAHVITRLILGGAQENTLYTAIGQHQDPRFDVTLVCGIDEEGEGDLFEQAKRAGIRVIVVPTMVRRISPWRDLRCWRDLVRLFRAERFDVVHTHSSKAGIVGRIAARQARIPVVVHTLHSLVFHEYQSAWKNALYILLKRICAPMTDTLISVNDQTARGALARRIGRPDQHRTIYSGMELERFLSARERHTQAEDRQRWGLPVNAPVVGKIARFFPLKGHDQFVDAAVEIARQRPDAWFLLVGDGPDRARIEERLATAGLGERTVLTGRVDPKDVPAAINAMDVVVHTSLREGIARVLPQAFAVGKPIVTFALDGAPEVVRDGTSGYLVPPLDTARLADCVCALLADADRRAAFGEAGRQFAAQHFDVRDMVTRINDVYFENLARRAPELLRPVEEPSCAE